MPPSAARREGACAHWGTARQLHDLLVATPSQRDDRHRLDEQQDLRPGRHDRGTIRNRRNDTQRKTFWTTIHSTSDEYVPNSSSRLDGGACHVRVSGIGHNEMDNNAGIFARVLAAVDGPCTGTFK
ncbi:MAG TPA: hypothetical protein VIL81_08700 [Candidatus Limnocylindrales bacterium]